MCPRGQYDVALRRASRSKCQSALSMVMVADKAPTIVALWQYMASARTPTTANLDSRSIRICWRSNSTRKLSAFGRPYC